MQINRYTQAPVARYNPMSMNELAFTPSMLRQRHDEVQQSVGLLESEFGNYDVLDNYIGIAEELVNPLRQNAQQLAEDLATQGINRSQGTNRAMKLAAEYKNTFGPSGGIGQLQGLKKQMTSAQEELKKRKDLENNPEVLNFALKQLYNSLPELKVQDGKLVGDLNIGSPNITRIFDYKERQDFYNNVLKNIQNDERFSGYNISSLDSEGISKLLTQGSLEYKDLDNIMEAMLASIPKEVYASEQTRMLANGYTPEEVSRIFSSDPYEIEYNEEGKATGIEYNSENPVIREMMGLSKSRVVSKEKTRVNQFTDSGAVSRYNKKLEDSVGGYDLPDQVIKIKNPWMEGITDEKSLNQAIDSLNTQLQAEEQKYISLGLEPTNYDSYNQMLGRKSYLEDMIKKIEVTPYVENDEWNLEKMENYNIKKTIDIENPNYNAFLESIGVEVPKDIQEGKRGWNTSDYSKIDYEVRKKLWKGPGKMPITGDSSDPNKYFNKENIINKITLGEAYQSLSTGFTRETSKSSQQQADDYIKTAFTSLVFIDPKTGEEIAGKDTETLKKLGITPESISYSAYSKRPTRDGNYLWQLQNVNEDGESTSYLVQAPQQFNTKKAIMDLQSVINNPNLNLKQFEQRFLSEIADAEAKGISRVPLGNNIGDLFIGQTPEVIPLPMGIDSIIKAPNGQNIPATLPQVFNYVLKMSQDNE